MSKVYNSAMAEEQLDLVSEDDMVIGVVGRAEANCDPSLIHRKVGVFLFDKAGNAFMQQRSASKSVFPLYWICAAAGHVGAGMDPEDIAHKELREELGFDIELTFWKKVLRRLPNETHWAYCYTGRYEGQTIKCDSTEIEQYRFFGQREWMDFINTGAKYDPLVHELTLEYWQQAS